MHKVGGGDGLLTAQADGDLISPQKVGNRGAVRLVYRAWGRGEVRSAEAQEGEDTGVEDGHVRPRIWDTTDGGIRPGGHIHPHAG